MGTVPSKTLNEGDEDAFFPNKFKKYLIKHTFLQFVLAPVLCIYF